MLAQKVHGMRPMILKYVHLKDEVLLAATKVAAQKEKEATFALLEYLVEVDRRKVYAMLSYSSLFDYLCRHLKHSEKQAAERVNALRLLRSTPEIQGHLESGELSLSTASQIQRFIQVEKRVGRPVNPKKKVEILDACLGKSKREVERILLSEASPETKRIMKERIRRIDVNRVELRFSVDESTQTKLEELKNLIGNESLERIFDRALEVLLTQERKKRGRLGKSENEGRPSVEEKVSVQASRSVAAGETSVREERVAYRDKSLEETNSTSPGKWNSRPDSRYIPIRFKRAIHERSQGRCEFVDSSTGSRCQSRFQLQIDHKTPLALGGKTELDNLRHLCPNHNTRAALEAGLGRQRSECGGSWRTPRSAKANKEELS